jgi:hypothetical protein
MATMLQLAEAQLLGWYEGKHGTDIITLVASMGLTRTEWEKIKKIYPNTLNKEERMEIDDYFTRQNNR